MQIGVGDDRRADVGGEGEQRRIVVVRLVDGFVAKADREADIGRARNSVGNVLVSPHHWAASPMAGTATQPSVDFRPSTHAAVSSGRYDACSTTSSRSVASTQNASTFTHASPESMSAVTENR